MKRRNQLLLVIGITALIIICGIISAATGWHEVERIEANIVDVTGSGAIGQLRILNPFGRCTGGPVAGSGCEIDDDCDQGCTGPTAPKPCCTGLNEGTCNCMDQRLRIYPEVLSFGVGRYNILTDATDPYPVALGVEDTPYFYADPVTDQASTQQMFEATSGLMLGDCDDIASAATVAVEDCSVVTFTGTTTVNTINTCDATLKGRVLVILCNALTPIGDGAGNVQLSAAFTCTADDTLSLICEGSTGDWLETARGVN
jgi:hypothetical protein